MGWRFQQLAGDKKVLTLDGYAAPFGRPRQQPVATEKVRVSIQTTQYPGSKGPPTRHSFGSAWEPMVLNGRWMTRHLSGDSDAPTMAKQWTEFVRDEQPIRMSWDNIVSYTGVIEDLELGRESEHEIAWKMTVLVDSLDGAVAGWSMPTVRSVDANAAFIQSWVSASESLRAPTLPDMAPSFFEQLDFLAGSLKSYTGALVTVAQGIESIEKSTFSVIQSFRGVIANIESTVVTMRNLILTSEIDAVLMVRRAESDIAWYAYQLDFDVESLNAFAILAEMDRQLELQARSDLGKFVQAQEGDTWERLATRAGAGPDNAGVLREANGIRFGRLPEPGQTYLVPS